MLILPFLRGLTTTVSLLILAAALYLLATWAGADTRLVGGVEVREREEWRLWWGLGLLAWSFLGRLPVLMLLGKPGGPRFARAPGGAHRLDGAAGASLHIETAGPADSPPLVMTHGWGMDSSIWSPNRDALAKRFRLVMWDLPGLGKSRAPLSAISLPAFADDLARVIDSAGPAPVVLVGHSIGGMIIQTLARDRPELFGSRVLGVVLLNTTHTNPLRTMILSGLMTALQPLAELGSKLTIALKLLVWLNAWQSYLSGTTHLVMRLGFGTPTTRRSLDHASLLSVRNSPAAQAQGNLAMFRWDATGALADLPVPVLVLAGDRDIVTKEEAGRRIAASAPRGELQEIGGGNHMSPLDHADSYNAAIAAFAEAVQRR